MDVLSKGDSWNAHGFAAGTDDPFQMDSVFGKADKRVNDTTLSTFLLDRGYPVCDEKDV